MRAKISVILLTSVAAILQAGPARADDRDDFRQMIEQQRRTQEMFIRRLDPLPGKRKIQDLLRVASDAGKLVIRSPIFDNAADAAHLRNRQVRAEVEGFDGQCTLMVQSIGNGGSQYFTFSNVSYPNSDGIAQLRVTAQPGYLQIVKTYTSRSGNFNLNLIQSWGRASYAQPDGVQLGVYGTDASGRPTVGVSLAEPDFLTLRRKHSRVVNEHLRPLLRQLKLEALFAVDRSLAWQVFADDYKGNDALARQVDALLAGLDRDGYQERDAARRAIQNLGPDAALVIYRMNRGALTVEQNCQLDAVLASYSFVSREEARRLAGDVDFLLDCLYVDDADVRATAAHYLEKAVGHQVAFDAADNDYDHRAARVETLRQALSPTAATTRPTNPH
ncbi:MAG TPA: hypothetical protein VH475_19840 [Tepidisphaeraceae bacterium]|jgi:hypothetical protein